MQMPLGLISPQTLINFKYDSVLRPTLLYIVVSPQKVFDFSGTPAFRLPRSFVIPMRLPRSCHFDQREKSCHRHRLRENSFPMQKVKMSRSARNDSVEGLEMTGVEGP